MWRKIVMCQHSGDRSYDSIKLLIEVFKLKHPFEWDSALMYVTWDFPCLLFPIPPLNPGKHFNLLQRSQQSTHDWLTHITMEADPVGQKDAPKGKMRHWICAWWAEETEDWRGDKVDNRFSSQHPFLWRFSNQNIVRSSFLLIKWELRGYITCQGLNSSASNTFFHRKVWLRKWSKHSY